MAFLDERIDKIKTIIINIEDALTAIISGRQESYDLDTGQSRQRVTRLDIEKLRKMYRDYLELLNELEGQSADSDRSSTIQIRGGW